jgi:hypothetical protein
MSDHDRFNELDGLRPTGPPPQVRDEVLSAATAAMARQPVADLWDRLWSNRPLRLAWAAAAALLVVGHVAITPNPPSVTRFVSLSVAGSVAQVDVELQDIANLPEISPDARVGLP